jgi:hypothetical protein
MNLPGDTVLGTFMEICPVWAATVIPTEYLVGITAGEDVMPFRRNIPNMTVPFCIQNYCTPFGLVKERGTSISVKRTFTPPCHLPTIQRTSLKFMCVYKLLNQLFALASICSKIFTL